MSYRILASLGLAFGSAFVALGDVPSIGDWVSVQRSNAELRVANAGGGSAFDFRTFVRDQVSFPTRWAGRADYVGTQVSGFNTEGLTAQVAYLYTQFASGTLSGYSYQAGAGRTASAQALQQAIWYFEGQVDAVDGDALTWVNQANAAINGGSWDAEWGDGTMSGHYDGLRYLGNVRGMNLLSVHQRDGRQVFAEASTLVLIPAPGAALLGLLGLGLGYRLRRGA